MTREEQLRKWLEESRAREAKLAKQVGTLEAKLRGADKVQAELDRMKADAEAEEERTVAERRAIVEAVVPDWLRLDPPSREGFAGVPTVFSSDWHGNEGVLPSDVGGVNEYGPAIFEARAKELLNRSVDLLNNHVRHGQKYPGIIAPFDGDMLDHLNRWIHTSEPENPLGTRSGIDCVSEAICGLVEGYVHAYGHVFSPCSRGNHGRLTPKGRYAQSAEENLDAVVYDRVRAVLGRDPALRKRVSIVVAPGSDIMWRAYGHRYLMVHGDRESLGSAGGDGIIGPAGPIIRGAVRLWVRASRTGRPFDTLLVGHYHQWMVLPGIIVNGSLKGFDAFAHARGFAYEPPRQAMWLTHPKWGITCHWPVYVDRKQTGTPERRDSWVEVDKLMLESA
ncbi:MAG TPA: hypothetical protein VF841_17515 [Anaeromyxobacter sp.]